MLKIKLPVTTALTLVSLYLFAHVSLAADIIPPTTTYLKTPASPDGKNGWYKSPVQFNITSTDLASGVKEIWYRIDSGTWQTVSFTDSLNLIQNPSFELTSGNDTGLANWSSSVADANVTIIQDTSNFAAGYAAASARIDATAGTWHGINNSNDFAVSSTLQNMSASVWLKTANVVGTASFKIYAKATDGTVTLISQSPTLTGTTAWTKLSTSFVVTPANTVGVYFDIGVAGTGTVWADAAIINSAATPANTNVTIASDNENHKIEFYSVDNAGNIETFSCTGIIKNCVTFKLDQTPPGNWHDSGAFRGLFGEPYQLFVYSTIEDATSGISPFTDSYSYSVDGGDNFGRYSNIDSCGSTWQPNQKVILITPPFDPGATSAYILTPRTSFCNTNWKVCKIVRFFSEDMAGNTTYKDLCINGPWIKLRNKGFVRANQNISMISDPNTENTDGLIEAMGNTIDFFTSSRDWKVKNAPSLTPYTYTTMSNLMKTKTTINTTGNLVSSSAVYIVNGNYNITSARIPSNYGTATFNQIVYINGDLKITNNISVGNSSTALFIVKGKVEIDKAVTTLKVGIMADGDFYTAYNIGADEGSSTLALFGIYSANKFYFQRTLQGTDNSDLPSEDFFYEPKYSIKLKDYFSAYSVTWKSTQ